MAALVGGGGGGAVVSRMGGFASSGDAKFDASQYSFFGNNVTEEVEIGGLEGDDDGSDATFGPCDEEYPSAYARKMLKDEGTATFTDVDDLAGTFSKRTRIVNETNQPGIGDHGGSISGQNWAQENGSSYWPKQHVLEVEPGLGNKNWWSQPRHPSHFADSKVHRTSSTPQQDATYNPNEPILVRNPSPSNRTSSYPQQEPQYNHTEPIHVPKGSVVPYPSSSAVSNFSAGKHHMNMPSHSTGFQMPISTQNELSVCPFSHGGTGSHPGQLFHRDLAHMDSTGLSNNNVQQNHVLNSGSIDGYDIRFTPTSMHHQLQRPNGLTAVQPPRQQHGILPSQQSQPQFSQLHPQKLGPQHSSPQSLQMFGPRNPSSQAMSRFNANFGMPDLSDPRARAMLHQASQAQHYPPQGFELSHSSMDNGWPRFRSKYMSTEEIENIGRMQQAATHINDPYIDDYYHQACLASKSAGAQLNNHFCPTLIKDPSSLARGKDEPHAYLQVDALGRLPFSSIHRPRPLLDVEQVSASSDNDNILENSASKSLDQEPMLASRTTVEDGLCLLLDVDDIDRLLQFSQLQDSSLQLRNRRQALLEQLAGSLQLVDPLGLNNMKPLSLNDDLVFLRIVSLPKGRKLLCRYIQRVIPGSELARIVCMAVFRHLRFIFGDLPSDNSLAEVTTKLARVVSICILQMELSGISACLAAVVCSSLQPPLRPVGHVAGDGASVVISTVLDRATELLTDPHVASTYGEQTRALWQASFDAFFRLLTGYCISRTVCLVQEVQADSAAAALVSRELPMQLLRASLPHTNEQQRIELFDFCKLFVPANTASSCKLDNGSVSSEFVPS